MERFEHIIQDPLGLHARPAAELVKLACGFESKTSLSHKRLKKKANAKRLFQVMGLGARQGDQLSFRIQGADEQAAYTALQNFCKNWT